MGKVQKPNRTQQIYMASEGRKDWFQHLVENCAQNYGLLQCCQEMQPVHYWKVDNPLQAWNGHIKHQSWPYQLLQTQNQIPLRKPTRNLMRPPSPNSWTFSVNSLFSVSRLQVKNNLLGEQKPVASSKIPRNLMTGGTWKQRCSFWWVFQTFLLYSCSLCWALSNGAYSQN